MKAFDYAIAESEVGALAALDKGYKIKASGIDLLDMLKERTEPADKFVTIHRLSSLKGIRQEDDTLIIGALTTLHEIAEDETVKSRFAALQHAAGEAATPQVRYVATAAGNLCQRPRCWYFRSKEYPCLKKGGATCYAVDGENTYHAVFGGGPCHIVHPSNIAPALLAANAEVSVRSRVGPKTIPMSEFFVLPKDGGLYDENALHDGELITEIRIPRLPEKSGYVEFREKQSFDWPITTCAAALVDGRWSVVLGAVAPVPWRSEAAEKVLEGSTAISKELAEKAADAALEGAEPMSQNAWRLKLVRAAVRRALLLADGKEID